MKLRNNTLAAVILAVPLDGRVLPSLNEFDSLRLGKRDRAPVLLRGFERILMRTGIRELFGDNSMSIDLSDSHPEMDVEQHKRTYDGFIAWSKYSAAAMAITLIAMAIFIL